MASSSNFGFIIGIFLLASLNRGIRGEIVLEEGYTVTTIIDGDKLLVNPYSVLSLYGSSSDLIILDSVKSTFYTVSVSNSQVTEIKKVSGSGDAGYMDGDLGSAMFNKPKSFALDMKNNIYIADKTNHVIRKISKSGVTTIAGGYVQKTGNADGPAQNASFSDDFELAFSPQRCALLISDHGYRLVRQIDLKTDDCANGSSGSDSRLGATIAWAFGVGAACLIGLIVGFAIRPYVLPHESSGIHPLNETWNHYLTNLAILPPTFFFDTKNAIASLKLFHLSKQLVRLSLSQLSLIFGLNIVNPPPTPLNHTSLIDSDHLGTTETTQTQVLVNEFKDLLTFDSVSSSSSSIPKPILGKENGKNDGFTEAGGKVDRLIYENFAGFVERGRRSLSD